MILYFHDQLKLDLAEKPAAVLWTVNLMPLVAVPLAGWLIDRYGWGVWYPVMAGFGAIGGIAMLMVMRKQRLMHLSGDPRAGAR